MDTRKLMLCAGLVVLLVETVGTGQSEVAIAGIANVAVVVCAPGLGDGVQALKAGILEVADILVVNKADLPAAPATIGQLQGMLALRGEARDAVPVLATIATSGAGVSELADAILGKAEAGSRSARHQPAGGELRRRLVQEILAQIRDRLVQADPAELDALGAEIQRGEVDLQTAARRFVDRRL